MKTSAFTTVACLAALLTGSHVLGQECNLSQETLDKINFENIAQACEYIEGDQTYDSCDMCLGSILGDLTLALYPTLGLDITTFPKSPAELAAALSSGDDLGLSALSGGPCEEFLGEKADAAGADIQAYIFSIIVCDRSVPWGPNVVAAVTSYWPGFVADPAST